MKKDNYLLEACVVNLEEARIAEQRGAHQIELCVNLDVGGTTPPESMIRQAQDELNLKVKVMIRPRGGSFVHTEAEMLEMEEAIRLCKSIGIPGVVFGNLNEDGSLHLEQIKRLANLAAPMEVTIHRAIDSTPDILEAVRQLSAMANVHSVLSAGKASNAIEGQEILAKMVETVGEDLDVIPGGRVTDRNVAALHGIVKARVYHGTQIVGPLNNNVAL